jgi:hypothetical protein
VRVSWGPDNQELGCITWLDFDLEFLDDAVPLPWVFGHTFSV